MEFPANWGLTNGDIVDRIDSTKTSAQINCKCQLYGSVTNPGPLEDAMCYRIINIPTLHQQVLTVFNPAILI